MRLVVKKSDRDHLLSCCNRQPIVATMIDFADEIPSRFLIQCPLCERSIMDVSFITARDVWNNEILCQSPNYDGGLIYE